MRFQMAAPWRGGELGRLRLLEVALQEGEGSNPGVLGGRFPITELVVRVFESMPRALIDLHVNLLVRRFHRRFEGRHGAGRNAPVVSSKIAQYGRLDSFNLVFLRGH